MNSRRGKRDKKRLLPKILSISTLFKLPLQEAGNIDPPQGIPTTKDEATKLLFKVNGDYQQLTPDQIRAIQVFNPKASTPVLTEPEDPIEVEVIPPPTSGLSDRELFEAIDRLLQDEESDDLIIEALRETYQDLSESRARHLVAQVRQAQAEDTAVSVSSQIGEGEEATHHFTVSYHNMPKEGIIARTRRRPKEGGTPRERTDRIISYYLAKVTKNQNPLALDEVTYTVLLRNSKRRTLTISYEEAYLSDITQDLANNQPGVSSKTRVHEAVSSLVDKLEIEGQVETKASIPATGFFEDDKGKLYFSTSKNFKTALPTYDRRETRRALEALAQVVKFYSVGEDPTASEACDHILACLYFSVSAPLSVPRKQAGQEAKVLLLTGDPHTGKTLFEKINAYIWGLPLNASVIGASKLSPAQLATHVSQTTLPLALDEVRNILSDPKIADMLKSSTTALLVKERILSRQGFRKQSFYAYAPLILSTNFIPELYAGVADRCIPVLFTARHKKPEEKVEAFKRFLNENKDLFAHIGAGLTRLFIARWGIIKGISQGPDQIRAGHELLALLYRQAGLEAPAWLRPVEISYDLPETDPIQAVIDYMREDLLKRLRAHYRPGDILSDWFSRLNLVKEAGILPPYITNISDRGITINNGLILALANEKGIEIPGGLTGLLARVNQEDTQVRKLPKPKPYKGNRVIYIDRELFYDRSNVPVEYQETI